MLNVSAMPAGSGNVVSMSTPGDLAGHPTADRPLRVCHLAKFYPPATGGIESHLRTLAQAQARRGAAVRVVCVNHLDAAGRDVTWKAFAATPTVEERDADVELLRVGRRASLFRFDLCPGLARLGRTLRDWGADVVHLHVPNPTMLLALLPCARRRPLVVTYHSDVVKQRKLGLAMRPLESVAYGAASRILATSPPYAEASPTLRRHAAKVQVLPFGIELAPLFSPSAAAAGHARRLRETHGEPLWLSVGRLVYYKGLSTALEALRDVPGKLLSIGEGPLEASLIEQAKKLGVADRVIFRGRAGDDELVGAYHAATALWFPSNARSEAFGFAQVEAMASGCPVINTAIPGSGVAWVSRHLESGLTVPVGDAAALAAAARRLLDEPGLRDSLAAGARDRAARDFGADRMAERTLEVYRQALTAAGGEARR
jgi:glycosyltransferase involved in cell wall biosynthesis